MLENSSLHVPQKNRSGFAGNGVFTWFKSICWEVYCALKGIFTQQFDQSIRNLEKSDEIQYIPIKLIKITHNPWQNFGKILALWRGGKTHKLLSSSDPHPDTLWILTYFLTYHLEVYMVCIYIFWHSFWYILWHSYWHSIGHLFWHSIW